VFRLKVRDELFLRSFFYLFSDFCSFTLGLSEVGSHYLQGEHSPVVMAPHLFRLPVVDGHTHITDVLFQGTLLFLTNRSNLFNLKTHNTKQTKSIIQVMKNIMKVLAKA